MSRSYCVVPSDPKVPSATYEEDAFIHWVDEVLMEGYKKPEDAPFPSIEESLAQALEMGYHIVVDEGNVDWVVDRRGRHETIAKLLGEALPPKLYASVYVTTMKKWKKHVAVNIGTSRHPGAVWTVMHCYISDDDSVLVQSHKGHIETTLEGLLAFIPHIRNED